MGLARAFGWFSVMPLVGLLAGACGTTLHAAGIQPNPLAGSGASADTLIQSQRLHIDIKDMELPQTFVLRNSAYFAVVSRDRLRFHVVLVHKWKEMAELASWQVWLEDDAGNRFVPEAGETRRNRHITRMWDHELRSVSRNSFGDVVWVNNDGYKRRVFLDGVDVFKGEGDFVFYARNLLRPDLRYLDLVMKSGGLEFRYTWKFRDDQTPGSDAMGQARKTGGKTTDTVAAHACY